MESRDRLLFLSHIHGDHMGAARLLVQRRKLDPPPEPLYIIANWVLAGYLREYFAGIEDLGWGASRVNPEVKAPWKRRTDTGLKQSKSKQSKSKQSKLKQSKLKQSKSKQSSQAVKVNA
ncbi:hypothetical protein CALVIDRAFT_524992 [Calocera viscosa TUFC12733]|uniref:Metallo-beta-lactamase domain-containing protein n=1 Tax=Calocera viscosa (strain TUFC12733) TaxID=1330018 RepID=A0A167QMR9_CALVF|nr:hypothetical protein CALVIDRAFT_524992 [Calocera viscosa TUFC12733]